MAGQDGNILNSNIAIACDVAKRYLSTVKVCGSAEGWLALVQAVVAGPS
jgi:hypothetical protein